MPRRIPIRSKLACALAVPLAGLMGGAVHLAVEARDVAAAARSQTDLAAAAVGPGSLVSQLQNERNFTSVDLIGMSDAVRLPVADLDEAREATDAALVELRRFVADRGPDAEAAFAAGLAAVEAGLADVRETVDAYRGPRTLENNAMGDAVFAEYAGIVEALLDGTAGLALRIDDADLRTGVELVDLSTRLYELRSSTIRAAVAFVLAADDSQEARLAIGGALDRIDALEATILQRAVEPYDGFAEFALNDAFVVRQESLMRGFAANGTLDVPELLGSVESGPDRGVLLVRRQASQQLLDEAQAVLDAADAEQRNAIVVGGTLVALALAMTLVVSRSITRPLASLTEQAETMASVTLPRAVQQVLETPLGDDVVIPDVAPIAVRTRDEVRDVAAALNVVQASALELAVEQAVLRRNIADSFVNMGRRNQNLLDRQLDFITDLEREEQDADRLASLFRLDHLATRMRRNAESLLRLAGSEPQRQLGAPIDMADVVRGALGEVEDYQRVQVRVTDSASLPAGAGADLAHALAELIENALSFSPPTEPVEIRGRRTADGYVIAVADAGLGMTADELLIANRRLAGQESFTVAPSRYLGHYVAGYLASRIGVRIELQPGPAGGLIARVDVPASLLVQPSPAVPAARPPAVAQPAMRAAASMPSTPAPAALPAPAAAPAAVVEPAVAGAAAASPVRTPWMASETELVDRSTTPGGLPRRTPPAEPNEPAATTAPTASPSSPFQAAPAPAPTTTSGLVRRVPGAQRPVTEVGRVTTGADTDDEADRMSPEAVSSFLSDFSAGVSRGIAEAGRNPWEEGS